ncbi:hypothetical protein [Chryseolinea lacunae]|uniref:Phosphoribosylpyrophosphate synthetase n=1 Tax=Chryseolinea lacunae TaxID=2801331 RepID=A0ABS1L0T0_9BACT|nr:hypothetical protein [Chryseolinea lacunae]MBL0745127.1 hypothetical protein [Chryseolinea lacunae]
MRSNSTEKMSTLMERTNQATKEGYTENFKVISGRLTNTDEEQFYTPEEVHIVNFHRFEGYSDPNDNSILYLIETTDGSKGQLIDAYGAYADAKLSAFIHDVENIQKQTKH